jgi:hypothetical protein
MRCSRRPEAFVAAVAMPNRLHTAASARNHNHVRHDQPGTGFSGVVSLNGDGLLCGATCSFMDSQVRLGRGCRLTRTNRATSVHTSANSPTERSRGAWSVLWRRSCAFFAKLGQSRTDRWPTPAAAQGDSGKSRFHKVRGVAQSGSAPGSGPGGRRFESSRPDQSINMRSPLCRLPS